MLIGIIAVASFATLGDGKIKSVKEGPKKSLLSNKSTITPGTFSLKSGYTYRGNQVINPNSEPKSIRLNTVVTLQKGNITYTVPLKKNVILDKVKIDISNRQLRRN